MTNLEITDKEDTIEKIVDLPVAVSRVWRALTDHEEFGQWFRVKIDGPFRVGEVSTGHVTYPGYEHYPWLATVEVMEHEKLFAYRWHDYDETSGKPIAEQPTTRVEFHLQAIPDGTRLKIVESGFSSLAEARRIDVMRGNTEGWNIQAQNIFAHVTRNG